MRVRSTVVRASASTRAALAALGGAERRSLAMMILCIVLLHVVGFGLLLGLVVPQHGRGGGAGAVLGAGAGLLAYAFGLRHGFDADHIAAVDNTTRKLLQDRVSAGAGRRPLAVGFWFSLGHSTVVFALVFLLGAGARTLATQVEDAGSTLHAVAAVVGPAVSGLLLWAFGCLNLVALIGAVRVLRRLRRGEHADAAPPAGGVLHRLLGGLGRSVRRPWHTYPIGLLFGLGFDTATEVGLLVLASGAATVDLPFLSVAALPILFAAGMCLVDTADGIAMNAVYGWAFGRPVRRVYYDLVVTTISVVAALGIGTVELVGVLADGAGVRRGPLAAVAGVPLDLAGFVIAGLFLTVWIVAAAIWRVGRLEERWSGRLPAE